MRHRLNLRRFLLLSAAVLAVWLAWVAVIRTTRYVPMDVSPVAYRCETGPRVYCTGDMSRCWLERDVYSSATPCDPADWRTYEIRY